MSSRSHSFFKYFGSKWSTVDDYPKPLFNTIVEPFAGSAQYSVRYWWYNIILSDIDPNVRSATKFIGLIYELLSTIPQYTSRKNRSFSY